MRETIGIPQGEYDLINSLDACTDRAKAAIDRFLSKAPYRRILLFGGSLTGRAVLKCMDDRFAGFVDSASLPSMDGSEGDCVVITTAPVHVPEVERTLEESALSALPVVHLFEAESLDIRLILETQPRCGTDYTIRNLCKSFGLGNASAFPVGESRTTPDALVHYQPGSNNGYVVKAHFTKTLHYPQYRYCPTLFLLGYFPDTYYRWARLHVGVRDDDYFLSADSPEWHWVKAHIPLHLKWLDYIRDKQYIRYEDYYTDFEGVMDIFARLLGGRPTDFERPRPVADRIYWTGEYGIQMDREVWETLEHAFKKAVTHYYPEKT